MGPILAGAATRLGAGLPGSRAPDAVDLPNRAVPQPGDLAVAVARHDPEGWKVAVMRGEAALIVLDANEARRLSVDLGTYADLCDGKWGNEE